MEQNIYDFEKPPPVQVIVQALRKCVDRGLGDNGELVLEKTRPNMPANLVFSISDFARLCVTLRDEPHSRKALQSALMVIFCPLNKISLPPSQRHVPRTPPLLKIS